MVVCTGRPSGVCAVHVGEMCVAPRGSRACLSCMLHALTRWILAGVPGRRKPGSQTCACISMTRVAKYRCVAGLDLPPPFQRGEATEQASNFLLSFFSCSCATMKLVCF